MRSRHIGLIAATIVCTWVLPAQAAGAAHVKQKVLHSFAGGSDGVFPDASLIDVSGTLYGTTLNGGTLSDGTVFALDPKTGAEIVLHAFAGGADGVDPGGRLVDTDGTLYGTTEAGGADSYGTLFSFDPSTGTEKVIYSFCHQKYCTDGVIPLAGLIDVNGVLYGTTSGGGTSSYGAGGTVFAVDPSSGVETVVYSFCSQENCTDGEYPAAGLIDVNGMLYGTTNNGGAYGDNGNCAATGLTGCGTVFAVDPSTGAEKVLYSFCAQQNCADGAIPQSALVELNGTLYGITYGGGANCQSTGGCGTVFAVKPNTGVEKVLYSFCGKKNCADGQYPSGDPIIVKGALYDATLAGGANCQSSGGCGTVFALDMKTGAENALYSFCGKANCTDGNNPYAGLISVKDTFYGTTGAGGTSDYGTVFALKVH